MPIVLIYFANTNMIQERQIVYICGKETQPLA